ncbi:hypothetical protein FKM82_004168 [Ascaphus truei]
MDWLLLYHARTRTPPSVSYLAYFPCLAGLLGDSRRFGGVGVDWRLAAHFSAGPPVLVVPLLLLLILSPYQC